MIIWIVLLFFSGAGIATILAKNLLTLRHLKLNEENLERLNFRAFFSEIEQYIILPIQNFIHNSLIPFIYKKIEKISRSFRIYILKLENKMFKFNNYIRGRRIIKENGAVASEYLQKLNGFKQNGIDKEPE